MELIAEIGPANGDIGYAIDAVNAAKESGFHFVKGQVYDRDLLTSQSARTYAQPGIKTPTLQYDDFDKQLTWDEWGQVAAECDRIGIGFFFSVFDLDGIRLGQELGVTRYKIASGDITFQQLIESTAATGKLVILSTGAATENEIRRAVQWVTTRNTNLVVLACTLSYPTGKEDANLARMKTIRPIWPEVGYSDHTYGVGAIHRAHQLGAVLVEKHFTITPGAGGDHDFAVTPRQMQHVVSYHSGDPLYDGNPELAPSLVEKRARKGARRSVHAIVDIPQGNLLRMTDVWFLRPGGGLEPWELDDYVGRPLNRDVPAGWKLTKDMF